MPKAASGWSWPRPSRTRTVPISWLLAGLLFVGQFLTLNLTSSTPSTSAGQQVCLVTHAGRCCFRECLTKHKTGWLPRGICLFSVTFFFSFPSWNVSNQGSLVQLKRTQHYEFLSQVFISFTVSTLCAPTLVFLGSEYLFSSLSVKVVLQRLLLKRQYYQSFFSQRAMHTLLLQSFHSYFSCFPFWQFGLSPL